MKALARDLTQRWESADEMRLALERALPQAIGASGKAELKDFMSRVLGDRRLARHEAIRRARLAADVHDMQSGSRGSLESGSSQSASSLRAISVSQSAGSDVSDLASPGALGKDKRLSRRRAWGIAASAGLLLALVLPATRALRAPEASSPTSARGVERGALLNAVTASPGASPASVQSLNPPASSPELPAAAVPSAPAVAETPSARPPRPLSKPAARSATGHAPERKKPATPPDPSKPALEDLIAPDYAH